MPHLKINRLLTLMIWGLLISGVIILLVAAVRNNNSRRCMGMKINISGTDDNLFIDENEVRRVVAQYVGSGVQGRLVSEFDLHAIENSLKRDIWIRDAKLYFDNNDLFRVSVVQREPVARVFTKTGHSFYIDSNLVMLPLSDLFSARVPVFTGFPADQKVLRHRDSLLLRDVRDLSLFINRDEFISAMIEQVDISTEREFEMIPKLGDQVIVFGDASDAQEKFSKMLFFYREMIAGGRINKYGKISLKFKGQVVATIRGMEYVIPDSVRTTLMMDMIAARAERMANDTVSRIQQDNDRNSTDVSIIQQSLERDVPVEASSGNGTTPAAAVKVQSATVTTNKPKVQIATKPAAAASVKPKPVNKDPAADKKGSGSAKPKAAPKAAPKAMMPATKKTNN